MHKYFSDLKWTESTSVQFESLSRGNILPLMYDLFDAGRIAMENFILFLSMLFNLRFKVQDALHRALIRSQAWLADCVNVMGIGSPQAQDFILYSYVLLAEDFHNALCQASMFSRPSIALWLQEVETIPRTGRNSLRDIQLTQVQNIVAGHISEAALGHFKLQVTPKKAGAATRDPLTGGRPRRTRDDKTAKAVGNPTTPPPKLTVTLTNPNIVTPATPASTQSAAASERVAYCHYFQSTQGCAKGSSGCPYSHVNPPRGDPARAIIKRVLAHRRMTLSPAFRADE